MPEHDALTPGDRPADTEPADWPGLWLDILAARSAASCRAPASPRAAPASRLAHSAVRGWTVDGPCSADSAALFALYKPLLDARQAHADAATAQPWAMAQLGQSLDGCVATSTGDSHFVTGPQSLLHLHRLRALSDAVLVGAGTVAADDPQLTTRRVPGPHPVRVVLDPHARLDGRARVLRDRQAPTLWLCDARHAAAARARLTTDPAAGAVEAEVLAVEGLLDTDDLDNPEQGVRPAGFRPARVLSTLAGRGLRQVFVEGGGVTVSRFLATGALDRLHLAIAPVLIGQGRRGLQGPPRLAMADCPRPPARMLALGEDVLWDLDLRGSPSPCGHAQHAEADISAHPAMEGSNPPS